ncbi:MAG: Ig-like domain-containing protein, partial [Myxococcota bacterium]|nr:Ig-like domain-containing protein [Myxococcota bacterium]
MALWDASAGNQADANVLTENYAGISLNGQPNAVAANTGNVLRHNTIVGGASTGFLLLYAQGNEVRENDRDGGSAGLHIYPGGWPNRVYWNNFAGWTWLGVMVDAAFPDLPIEISHDGKGNHWGRPCPGPLFTPGVDSNRLNVTDSFAYGARDAWLVGGVPGCAPLDATPPDPPVIRLPAEGDVVFTSTPTIIGAAEPDSAVTVLEGSIVIGTAVATESGEFAVVAAPPLAAGPHTIHATAVDAAGNESVPSAARTFGVRAVSDVEPLVAAARKFQVVELADFPDPLESALAPNRLRIVAKVDPVRGLGGASRNHRFLAIGRRALRDSATGRVLHTTLGFTEIPNVAGSAGEPVQVVVADHWCGAGADGRQVEAGRAYPYDLSVKLVRQYVGRGVGSRCSRGEQVVDVGPGSSACLIDSLDVSNVGVVNVAAVAPAAERPRPYCSADLVMLTDKARGLSWPDLVYDRPYFTGALTSIWGEDFAITPSAVGCERRTIEDQAACVLGLTTAFGIDRPDVDLRLIGADATSTNHRIVRFQQVVQRWDVDGSQVLVTFAPDGKVTEVTSHFIPGLRVVNSRTGDYAADFAAFDRTAAEASVLSALSRLDEPMPAPPVLRFRDEVIFVDHAAESSEGRLAVYVVAEVPDAPDRKYIAVVDAADARVLLVRPVTAGAGITVDTLVAYPAFSEDRCTPPEGCPHPYDHCSPLFVDGGRCVDRCSVAEECSWMDPWASCAPDIYGGTCTVRPYESAVRVYEDGWTSPAYSAFLPYATLVDDLRALRLFFAEDLGRTGWDDSPDPTAALPFHTYLMSGASAGAADPPVVQMPLTLYNDFPGSSMLTANRYRVLAHEWSHNLVTCTTAPCRPCGECLRRGTALAVGHDCLGEGIADLYGALFAVRMFRDSPTSWTESAGCPWGVEFRETPWLTRSYGLAPCY